MLQLHKYIERLIPCLLKWKDKNGQMLIVMITWVSRTSAINWATKIICDRECAMFYKLTCLQVGHITEYANCVSRYCPGTNAIFVCEGGLGRIRLSQLLLKPSAEALLQSHAIMQRLKLNLNLKKKIEIEIEMQRFWSGVRMVCSCTTHNVDRQTVTWISARERLE